MFKIEVVAADAAEMATKLARLAEIYRVGASTVHHHADAIARQAGINLDGTPRRETVVEAPPAEEGTTTRKPRGRKAATPETDASPPEAPIPVGVPATLTMEIVRKEMMAYVDAFAAKNPTDENAKRSAFKSLLDEIKAAKLSELPEGQFADMIALAKKKHAEISAA